MSETWSDGFTDIGRNCHCGSGVLVLVDEYHGKCGVCGYEKLTMAGENKRDEKYRTELLAKMQAERDAYNAEHPGEA
jgi:hypothetical protein